MPVGVASVVEDCGIRRVEHTGEVYVNLTDVIHLCEISRDRHVVYGHCWAARAMEGFLVGLAVLQLVS